MLIWKNVQMMIVLGAMAVMLEVSPVFALVHVILKPGFEKSASHLTSFFLWKVSAPSFIFWKYKFGWWLKVLLEGRPAKVEKSHFER